MLRLMEVLLHGGTLLHGWRTAHLQHAILAAFGLTPSTYTLTQLRYDLRKMRAHGLLERDGARYAYRLTDKGRKVALLFVLFHNASAARSPTACSTIRPTPRRHRRRRSKRPIEKPTDQFSTFWTFSLRECLNSERKILRLVHQEPRASSLCYSRDDGACASVTGVSSSMAIVMRRFRRRNDAVQFLGPSVHANGTLVGL